MKQDLGDILVYLQKRHSCNKMVHKIGHCPSSVHCTV